MRPTSAVLALLLAARAPAEDLSGRVFDLTPYYRDDAAWREERRAVEAGLEAIGRFRGRASRSAADLADALDAAADLRGRAAKMAIYGILRAAVDSRSEDAREKDAAGSAIELRVDEALGFLDDEVRALGAERVAAFRRAEPRIGRHRIRLHEILRRAPHTPPRQARDAVAALRRWPQTAEDAYWALFDSDLGWPRMRGADGAETLLDRGAYARLRTSTDRAVRQAAQRLFLGRMRQLEAPFGVLLTRRVEADSALARRTGFESGVEALLFDEGLPRETTARLFTRLHAGRPALARAVALRARALRLENPSYPDLLAPVPVRRTFTVAGAEELALAAAAPLGAEYQRLLRERLATPWIHLAPTPGKRDTYGVWYTPSGVPARGVMTWNGDLASSSSFAFLAFGKMLFDGVPGDNPPDTLHDPGIFANVVGYVARILHDDVVKERATDPEERVASLVRGLDDLRTQFFRNGVTTELEAWIEERVLAGDFPSGARISEKSLELLRATFGPSLEVPDELAAEWVYGRVSFGSFQTHNFPLAIAAACDLVERLRAGRPAAKDAMFRTLRRGESDVSHDLLRGAGVDLATDAPYDALLRRMARLSDELEAALAARDQGAGARSKGVLRQSRSAKSAARNAPVVSATTSAASTSRIGTNDWWNSSRHP